MIWIGLTMTCILLMWSPTGGQDLTYPQVRSCGTAEPRPADSQTFWEWWITPNDPQYAHIRLGADEYIDFRITPVTEGRRRRRRLNNSTGCETTLPPQDEGDDVYGVQPLPGYYDDDDDDTNNNNYADDSNYDDDGIGCDLDFEDDDAGDLLNMGGDSHQFLASVKEGISGGLLSKKFGSNEDAISMKTRGQQPECGLPDKFEIEGIKGEGKVQVTVDYFRRENWNLAHVDFDAAQDVMSQSTWCGNINWIKDRDEHLCPRNFTTPKWKVFLQQNSALLVTAQLRGRLMHGSNSKSLRVMLRIYSEASGEKVDDIFAENVSGRHTYQGLFNNTGAASHFYLELDHEVRHLYQYKIAFQVVDACADHPSQKFPIPQFQKSCQWLAEEKSRIERFCVKLMQKSNAHTVCKDTCLNCDSVSGCFEHPTDLFYRKSVNCKYVREKKTKLTNKGQLDEICNGEAGKYCPSACGKC